MKYFSLKERCKISFDRLNIDSFSYHCVFKDLVLSVKQKAFTSDPLRLDSWHHRAPQIEAEKEAPLMVSHANILFIHFDLPGALMI